MCTRKAQKYIIECACMAQDQLQISRFYVKVLEGQIKNIGLYIIWWYIFICYIFLLFIYKCGHRNVLSKRQVWMSIFHIINFNIKKKS